MNDPLSKRITCPVFSGHIRGAIDIKYEKELDELDIKIIRKKIQEISFWEMPEKSDTIGLDGSVWTLSVKYEDKKHAVRRWSPQSDTSNRDLEGFRDLGYYLADICGIHPIYGKQTESDQGGVVKSVMAPPLLRD